MIHWSMSTFTGTDPASPDLDINTFAPTGLDIDQWLDACVSAGMNYVTLISKHHDGFALWPTTFAVDGYDPYSIAETTWYANNGSPDVVGLFVTKCRTRGLNPCLYFSMWDTTWETRTGTDETNNAAGYLAMIQAQLTELLTNYGDITALWFDGWGNGLGHEEIQFTVIYEFIKNLQPNCLVLDNCHDHPPLTSEIEVYEAPSSDGSIQPGNTRLSEEVNKIRSSGGWFYNQSLDQTSATLRSVENILAAVSNANNNNGTYLLAITPSTAGALPAAQVTRLGELGA
jgi:alpha-L-fucosidase